MSQRPHVHPSPCPSQKDIHPMNYLFPAGAPPPAHPNTDPRCNSMSLSPPSLPMAKSPLIRDTWRSYLADYPDGEFVSAILNIIDVGASIGHSGPHISQLCNNLRSALDHRDIISKEIASLCSERRIHGLFKEPP